MEGAIPGEYIAVRIVDVQPTFAKGGLLRIKKRSSHRQDAPCSVFESCGGCQLQHIDYPMQLRLKRELVEEAFSRYFHEETPPIRETIGMDVPWNYRNKAQLPLRQQGSRVVMGMFARNSHQLVDIKACAVQHAQTDIILEAAREVVEQQAISNYNKKKHTGVLRNLVVRYGFETREAQLVLISRVRSLPQEKKLIQALKNRVPHITSLVLNHQPHRTSLVFGEKSRVLWGKEKLPERLGSFTFLLSAPAFFSTESCTNGASITTKSNKWLS